MDAISITGPVYMFEDMIKSTGLTTYNMKDLIPEENRSYSDLEELKKQVNFTRDHLFDYPDNGLRDNNLIYWKSGAAGAVVQQEQTSACKDKSFVENLVEREDVSASTTTGRGTRISFMAGKSSNNTSRLNFVKIERADGLNIVVDLKSNARINEGEDGSLSIYYPETQEMQVFDKEGNLTSTFAEGGGNVGTDGDDVFISIQGGRVDLGKGNDTVINASDNAYIYAGDGDNHIINLGYAGSRNVHVSCGNGNNTLEMGGNCRDGSITTGNGNNTVSGGLVNSPVVMGDGNHRFKIFASQGDITVGTGNTLIEGNYLSADIKHAGGKLQVRTPGSFTGNIATEGDLDADIQTMWSSVDVKGIARIKVNSSMLGSKISTGDGDDDICLISGSAIINTGKGNDSVTTHWGGEVSVNGHTPGRMENLIGSRLTTAFLDPFFSSIEYDAFNMGKTLADAFSIRR